MSNDKSDIMKKYIKGLESPPDSQDAFVRGDPQLQFLKGDVFRFLDLQTNPICLIDFGCGDGPLLSALSEFRGFRDKGHQYVGVDLHYPKTVASLAAELGLMEIDPQPVFLNRSAFFRRGSEDFPTPVKLIILRNVLHEIPPDEWAPTFFNLTRLLDNRGSILIQDMTRLNIGEMEAITWDEEEIRLLFPARHYIVENYSDMSRTGTPWMNCSIMKSFNGREDLKAWEDRASSITQYKYKKIGSELDLMRAQVRDRGHVDDGLKYMHLAHLRVLLERYVKDIADDYPYYSGVEKGVTIGNTSFSVVILEGDGYHSFGPNDIRCEVAEDYELPTILQSVSGEIIDEAENDAKKRSAVLFNGLHYGLLDFKIDVIDPITENRILYLQLKPTTYYDHISSNYTIDKKIIPTDEGQKTIRDYFKLRPKAFRSSPLANQFGMNIAVITEKDSRLLFGYRSTRTYTYAEGYVTGINASMSRFDGFNSTTGSLSHIPDPFLTAVREAKEELGLVIDKENIKFYALAQNLWHLQPILLGACYLRCSAAEVFETAELRTRDRFEYEGLLSIPFDPDSVAQHITSHYRYWIPQCALAVIYSLIAKFGYDDVVTAFEGQGRARFLSTGSSLYAPTIRRNIRDFIQESIRKNKISGNVIDIGSGYRSNRIEILRINKELDVKTVDCNPNVGADFLLKAEFMDRIADNAYDCAVCTELLEHTENPIIVLKEIKRILKPDGLLVLSVPFAVEIHERKSLKDYWRFTPSGLLLLLEQCGFHTIKIDMIGEKRAPINVMATAKKSNEEITSNPSLDKK